MILLITQLTAGWMLRTEVTDSMTIMMKTVGLEDIYPIQE